MSRTDKTKPLWVRHAEHGPRAVHDHRFGACDLPSRPERRETGESRKGEESGTRCRWEHPGALLFRASCCAGCGRRGCTAEWQRYVKESNRRERYEGRRLARRALRGEYDGWC